MFSGPRRFPRRRRDQIPRWSAKWVAWGCYDDCCWCPSFLLCPSSPGSPARYRENCTVSLQLSENCRQRQKRRPASANVRTFLVQRKKKFDENQMGSVGESEASE